MAEDEKCVEHDCVNAIIELVETIKEVAELNDKVERYAHMCAYHPQGKYACGFAEGFDDDLKKREKILLDELKVLRVECSC